MSGEVPEGWSKGGLGQFLRAAQGGGTPPRENPAFWNGDIPWASVKDMTSRALRPQETITPEGLKNSTSRVVAAGTNILALRMAVGSVARYAMDIAINQDLVALVPDERLDPDFLFHWLSAQADQLKSVATGTTVKGLRKDVLLGWPILLPPLDEQRRIAEVLRSVDEATSGNRAVLAKASESLALLSDQLLVVNAQRIGEPTRLGDLIETLEAGVSVNSEGRTVAPDEIGILKTSCVSAGYFEPTEHKAVLESERSRVRTPVSGDSIIISRMNTFELVGANAFVNADYADLYLPDRLWLLKTNARVRVSVVETFGAGLAWR